MGFNALLTKILRIDPDNNYIRVRLKLSPKPDRHYTKTVIADAKTTTATTTATTIELLKLLSCRYVGIHNII